MNISWKKSLPWLAVGSALAAGHAVRKQRSAAYSFQDRNVLITGGSRGLGLVLTRQLVERTAHASPSARGPQELERAVAQVKPIGDIAADTCDITDREQVHRYVKQLLQDRGHIDVLINNAGIIQCGPMEEMTIGDYEEAMNTHFYGPLYFIESILPGMRQRGAGRIVNISSIGGLISVPHLVPYCTSKFALVGYSLGIRSELAKDGILVTTICPGLMRTGSPRNAYFKGQHQQEYALFKTAGSLPLVSLNAERAARKILRVCQSGRALAVLGAPMQAAATAYGLFPEAATLFLGVSIPSCRAGGIGKNRLLGAESASIWSETPLTLLTDAAALRNNEVPGSIASMKQ